MYDDQPHVTSIPTVFLLVGSEKTNLFEQIIGEAIGRKGVRKDRVIEARRIILSADKRDGLPDLFVCRFREAVRSRAVLHLHLGQKFLEKILPKVRSTRSRRFLIRLLHQKNKPKEGDNNKIKRRKRKKSSQPH